MTRSNSYKYCQANLGIPQVSGIPNNLTFTRYTRNYQTSSLGFDQLFNTKLYLYDAIV